jgi:hypothetical protein
MDKHFSPPRSAPISLSEHLNSLSAIHEKCEAIDRLLGLLYNILKGIGIKVMIKIKRETRAIYFLV